MIFSVSLDWLLDGRKTETRRPTKAGEWFDPERQAVIANGRVKWRVGGNYAVQPGRAKHAIARFDLGSIREEKLQEITEVGARAEGCRDRCGYYCDIDVGHIDHIWAVDAYRKIWESLGYPPGYRWDDNPKVWVLGGIEITHRACDSCHKMFKSDDLHYHLRSIRYLCGRCFDWITTVDVAVTYLEEEEIENIFVKKKQD